MSEPTLKRKRSLKDSTVDFSKMRMVLNQIDALKDELYGIEETEEEMRNISEQVLQLEKILEGAKKPKKSFSTVLLEELEMAGVQEKRLVFDPVKLTDLTNGLTTEAGSQIADLHARIKEIYACVNMDYEPGSRMILDAFLLALRKITSTQEFDVAILPEMRITHGDGVQLSHPTSGYELWLGDRLLGPGGSRRHAFEIANARLFLVEAKRQSDEGLSTHFPEAISQAIAVLKIANLPEVRFCLSDGQTWIFFILRSENNTLTYYESAIHRLSRDIVETTDLPLREIMQLLREWSRRAILVLLCRETERPLANAPHPNTSPPPRLRPTYRPLPRRAEPLETTRARLVYQSRKRGTLESDLLLNTFAQEHLGTMDAAELSELDKLMDEVDWDIYITGRRANGRCLNDGQHREYLRS
ncbi:Flavinator of succinate dehydrogenase-domain-containing protein [Lactarius akahatsu]|uniref:Flavinator of succinate dehydrogenase-domain-containing protein n=1 Tax=Lactarius akahatsu TaxID=416441 RepID=A0AAD4LJP2_9AGAM|nr:Flavinator of succinate dehydrogenase-domain-containing protein [Lactarius akahatsu]